MEAKTHRIHSQRKLIQAHDPHSIRRVSKSSQVPNPTTGVGVSVSGLVRLERVASLARLSLQSDEESVGV